MPELFHLKIEATFTQNIHKDTMYSISTYMDIMLFPFIRFIALTVSYIPLLTFETKDNIFSSIVQSLHTCYFSIQ